MFNNMTKSRSVGRQSDFANDLEQEQEDLQDAREEVLGARFRLQALRKRLNDLRQETGIKDGLVFSQMRRVIHERDFDVLKILEEELNEAAALRDSLGLMEVEYEEAEAKYNSLEWKYSRKEARFAEGLLANDFVPNNTFAPRKETRKETTREVANLIRFAGEKLNNTVDSTMTDKLGPTYSPEVPGSVLGRSLPPSNQDLAGLHKASYLRSTQSLGQFIKKHNDRIPAHARVGSVEKQNQVDTWLLDTLRVSRWDKARLRNKQGMEALPSKAWWKEVEDHWYSATDVAPMFHTGDSTVADPDDSHCSSTSVNDNTGSASSEMKVQSTPPLQPGLQSMDSLHDDRPDDPKSGNLDFSDSREFLESRLPGQNLQDNTDHSISTGDPVSRRTSASSRGHGSVTTWGESSVNLDCTNGTRQWVPASAEPEIPPHDGGIGASDQDDQSVSSTPTRKGQTEDSSATPRLASGRSDVDASIDRTHQAAATMSRLLEEDGPQWSYPREPLTQLDLTNSIVRSPDLFKVPLPRSPAHSPSEMTASVHSHPMADDSQLPSSPSPVTTSEPILRAQFPYPFLRLTAPATQPPSSKEQLRSHRLPFVSSHSRIQLPGPAPEDLYF
jgi:hypothetical protein